MTSYSASLRLVAGGGFEPPFIRFPALWEVRDLPSDEDFLTLCCRAHHCGGAKGGNRTLCPKPHPPLVRPSAPLRPSLAGTGWTSRPSRAICCVFVLNRWSPPSFFAPGTRANKYRASKGLLCVKEKMILTDNIILPFVARTHCVSYPCLTSLSLSSKQSRPIANDTIRAMTPKPPHFRANTQPKPITAIPTAFLVILSLLLIMLPPNF